MTQVTTTAGPTGTQNSDRLDATPGDSFSTRRTLLIAQVEGGNGPSVIIEIIHTYPSAGEAVEAIRNFVKTWRGTSEGERAYVDSMADFNWGDVAQNADVLSPLVAGVIHLTTLDHDCLVVNHDELLMEPM